MSCLMPLVGVLDFEVGGELAEMFSQRMLERVADSPGGLFRRAARRIVAELAPVGAEEQHLKSANNRYVKLSQARDGMAFVNAYLTAVDAQRVYNAVTDAAETCPVLHGTSAQNNADALVGLVVGSLQSDGSWVPAQTEIQIVVPLDVLTGEKPGVGSVAGSEANVLPAQIRELLDDARIRRVVTDPTTGQILEFGRSTYRPPVALRDHVVLRDQLCRFPGCKRMASNSDLDHVESWDSGGETREGNLISLCRRHHNLKTHLGWTCELLPDGSVRWCAPSGYQWTDPARRLTG